MVSGSVLLLGGTRSGKSALAESMAEATAQSFTGSLKGSLTDGRESGGVTYVATGPSADPSMGERIAAHQERRPVEWTTLEVGADLVAALDAITDIALVDSLGTWVAAHHDFHVDIEDLVAALARRQSRGQVTILVSDEVGMGVHPATELGQRFRDVLGEVNAAVSAVVDEAMLVVAGRVLRLDQPE